VTSRWRGRGQATERVTPRPPRSWGLMGKVLAGGGGFCGACGTPAVAREAARTGQFGFGEESRQVAEGSGGPGRGGRGARGARPGPARGGGRLVCGQRRAASQSSGPGRFAPVLCPAGAGRRCPCAPSPRTPMVVGAQITASFHPTLCLVLGLVLRLLPLLRELDLSQARVLSHSSDLFLHPSLVTPDPCPLCLSSLLGDVSSVSLVFLVSCLHSPILALSVFALPIPALFPPRIAVPSVSGCYEIFPTLCVQSRKPLLPWLPPSAGLFLAPPTPISFLSTLLHPGTLPLLQGEAIVPHATLLSLDPRLRYPLDIVGVLSS
jgi:hypothetical protein